VCPASIQCPVTSWSIFPSPSHVKSPARFSSSRFFFCAPRRSTDFSVRAQRCQFCLSLVPPVQVLPGRIFHCRWFSFAACIRSSRRIPLVFGCRFPPLACLFPSSLSIHLWQTFASSCSASFVNLWSSSGALIRYRVSCS
jgi:hypothetical protein